MIELNIQPTYKSKYYDNPVKVTDEKVDFLDTESEISPRVDLYIRLVEMTDFPQ